MEKTGRCEQESHPGRGVAQQGWALPPRYRRDGFPEDLPRITKCVSSVRRMPVAGGGNSASCLPRRALRVAPEDRARTAVRRRLLVSDDARAMRPDL